MRQLHVKIPDFIDDEFRRIVVMKYGFKKGSLTKAVKEALLLWIEKNKEKDDKYV